MSFRHLFPSWRLNFSPLKSHFRSALILDSCSQAMSPVSFFVSWKLVRPRRDWFRQRVFCPQHQSLVFSPGIFMYLIDLGLCKLQRHTGVIIKEIPFLGWLEPHQTVPTPLGLCRTLNAVCKTSFPNPLCYQFVNNTVLPSFVSRQCQRHTVPFSVPSQVHLLPRALAAPATTAVIMPCCSLPCCLQDWRHSHGEGRHVY